MTHTWGNGVCEHNRSCFVFYMIRMPILQEADSALSILCWSQLGLCLFVLSCGDKMKKGSHAEEKGGSKSYPTLPPCNCSKARDRERDNHLESSFTQLRSGNPSQWAGGTGQGLKLGHLRCWDWKQAAEAWISTSMGKYGPTVPSLMVGRGPMATFPV